MTATQTSGQATVIAVYPDHASAEDVVRRSRGADMGDTHCYERRDGHRLPHDPLRAIVAPRPIGWPVQQQQSHSDSSQLGVHPGSKKVKP